MLGPGLIQGKGPFPPTPENVWLALLIGAIFGAVIALVTVRAFKKGGGPAGI